MFSSLAFRNYQIIFLYSCLNSSAFFAGQLAIEWLVLDLTESAAALGAMVGIQVAPIILVSLIGGSFADKFSEKRILLITATLSVMIYGALYFSYNFGKLDFARLALLGFTLSIVGAMQGPVFTALSVKVVPEERVANAMSLNSVSFNIGRLFGPILAGLLIAFTDTGEPFIYLSALYLIIFGVLLKVNMSELHQNSSARASGNMREAFAFLHNNRALYLPMVITGIFIGLGMNFSLISSLMVRQVFNQDSKHLGYVGVFLAIGGLVGAGYIARLSISGHIPNLATLLKSGVALGIFWLGASVTSNFWRYAVVVFFVNLFHLSVMATTNGLIAARSPVDLQGRIYGIYLFIFHLGFGIGAPLIGFLANELGIRITVGVGGGLTLLLSILLLSRVKNFAI